MDFLLLFISFIWPFHCLTANATCFLDPQLLNISYKNSFALLSWFSHVVTELFYGDQREHKHRYFRNTSENHVRKSQITKIYNNNFSFPLLQLHFLPIPHACEQQADIAHLTFRQEWAGYERLSCNSYHKVNSLSLEEVQGRSIGGRFMPSDS